MLSKIRACHLIVETLEGHVSSFRTNLIVFGLHSLSLGLSIPAGCKLCDAEYVELQ